MPRHSDVVYPGKDKIPGFTSGLGPYKVWYIRSVDDASKPMKILESCSWEINWDGGVGGCDRHACQGFYVSTTVLLSFGEGECTFTI
jgi:hypothetical protein